MDAAIIIIVLAVALLVGGTFLFVARTRRARGPELEPPVTGGVLAPPRPTSPTAPTDAVVVDEDVPVDVVEVEPPVVEAPVVEAPPKRPSVRERLARARATFAGFLGRSRIDEETWEELEEALIRADLGVAPTMTLLEDLRTRVKDEGLETGDQLVVALKEEMKQRLQVTDRSLRLDEGHTNVWLFVGVNGVGKTTTIGKVGKRQVADGHRVVMAAGDTFRAAAAEQLETWAGRAGADLVRGAEGGDPSAIIFDAIESAAAKGADLVLADTAGRLHTKANLMEELRKVRRVADRDPGHVTEVLLVLDATTGQNGLVQARQFTEATEVTGVVLTKLDGSAKGGIVFAIHSELGIPVKLVGLGETADDLVDFDPDEFVEALFS
ncbi:MAG TPA: signal recognition particle-docking protein FtsY [Aquihabitans sp.]|jgi:fused signal recognition particle receptor|nr:signal recognition particle-docking protein FtsY [Aquihabitans sp.]